MRLRTSIEAFPRAYPETSPALPSLLFPYIKVATRVPAYCSAADGSNRRGVKDRTLVRRGVWLGADRCVQHIGLGRPAKAGGEDGARRGRGALGNARVVSSARFAPKSNSPRQCSYSLRCRAAERWPRFTSPRSADPDIMAGPKTGAGQDLPAVELERPCQTTRPLCSCSPVPHAGSLRVCVRAHWSPRK